MKIANEIAQDIATLYNKSTVTLDLQKSKVMIPDGKLGKLLAMVGY